MSPWKHRCGSVAPGHSGLTGQAGDTPAGLKLALWREVVCISLIIASFSHVLCSHLGTPFKWTIAGRHPASEFYPVMFQRHMNTGLELSQDLSFAKHCSKSVFHFSSK